MSKPVLVALAAALLAVVAAAGLVAARARAAPPAPPPNFVVITADDQSLHTFTRAGMPNVFAELVHGGTTFKRSFAAPPLCCPDRAGFLTGEYPHNSGVFSNNPGYPELIDPGNIVPAWLHNAGYRTALIGKYLNKTTYVLGRHPAPGWDHWFGIRAHPDYYDAKISNDGVVSELGDRYLTRVLDHHAVRYIDQAAEEPEPFFIWLTHFAPHRTPNHEVCPVRGAEPLAGDYRRVMRARIPLPRDPSFNEDDVSDKPPPINGLRRLDAHARERIRARFHCALAAMADVDRGVGQIVAALRATHELQNTVLVYTSDNGFEYGEHRIPSGKADIYEPTIRVPLVIRLPRSLRSPTTPSVVRKPVAEIDLAPTMLDLAGGAPACTSGGDCRVMDGRSLAGLLDGSDPTWPLDRAILIELWERFQAKAKRPHGTPCPLYGLRTATRAMALDYARDAVSGECVDRGTELYDLADDPYELENVGSDPDRAGEVETLRARLRALLGCRGIAGRDPPSSGGYCE